MTHRELAAFSQYLAHDIALPVLSQGYGKLAEQLRGHGDLAVKARAIGVNALLESDSPELDALRKGNKELVTGFEKEAEARMRREVAKIYPEHAIVGEEHGYTPGNATRWVFDPVDGTSAMIRCAMAQAFDLPLPQPRPAFGITIGVVEGDTASCGLVAQLEPGNNGLSIPHTWTGQTGSPSMHNGKAITLPPCPASMRDTILASTVPRMMFNTAESWAGFQALEDATGKPALTDQNCIGFMRLLDATSHIGIIYEADLAYHDAAALIPILEGAGITVTDAKGNRLLFPESALKSEYVILAAQPPLHAQALALVKKGLPADRNRFGAAEAPQMGYAQKFPKP